ncbi:uncharacterized protein LOC120122095 [Hibiscus syriacus]|uniref:uncharacterized protein LOC120122095 n=1 Tax=Hibiscus syriacus TaxID=106335 RepID=UPI001921FAB9|nr:uncharacterized protein LOC120122095 [Hibiscus syriacus]
MAEASRGRVTITLGRTGQVKWAGHTSSGDFSDSHHVSGSKRSVRDGLGSNVDGSLLQGSQLNNKRQRIDGYTTSLNANGLNDKIFAQLMPYGTHQMPDSRERIPEPRERVPDSRETSIPGRIPSTRSANDFPRVSTSRSPYSRWTLDHLRQCSPDRVMGTSRGISPKNAGEIQRRQVNKTYDDVRAVSYMGKDIFDAPGPVSTTSFVTKSRLPTTSAKPIPLGPQIPVPIPPSSIVQKPSFAGVEQQTVEGLLHSLGLGKYGITFKEEVDMTALKQMGENDLKELGIPMGPRKKILLALLPRPKRQP